jgi:hypothetical protein
MKNITYPTQRRNGAVLHHWRWLIGCGLLLAFVLVGLYATPATAVGTTPNTISVGAAPGAGSAHGTYTPHATATSGDNVIVTIDKSSSGCSLSGATVTFTGGGTCVVDYNDPGNATYAAAAQVTQSVKVYAKNVISTSAVPSAGSTGGRFAPGSTATSGDRVVVTLDKSSTGCALSGVWVDFTGLGRCKVDFNDPGNGPFGPASQVQRSVTVYAANVIYVSTPPAAGAIHETYSPVTSSTSGDKVAISLASSSTGCSLSAGKVTFTDNGVCIIDFNDPGNGAFAAATEVKQSITVGLGNPIAQSPITITSTATTAGQVLTLTTAGGSGSGAVTYSVEATGSAGCAIAGDSLTSAHPGTCEVVATKAAEGMYLASSSPATTITVAAPAPRAVRVNRAVWVGRTMTIRVYGTNFYGRPLVVSNSLSTSAVVTHDNGRTLTVRVHVTRRCHPGRYRLTIVFAHGQRTSLHYYVR